MWSWLGCGGSRQDEKLLENSEQRGCEGVGMGLGFNLSIRLVF